MYQGIYDRFNNALDPLNPEYSSKKGILPKIVTDSAGKPFLTNIPDKAKIYGLATGNIQVAGESGIYSIGDLSKEFFVEMPIGSTFPDDDSKKSSPSDPLIYKLTFKPTQYKVGDTVKFNIYNRQNKVELSGKIIGVDTSRDFVYYKIKPDNNRVNYPKGYTICYEDNGTAQKCEIIQSSADVDGKVQVTVNITNGRPTYKYHDDLFYEIIESDIVEKPENTLMLGGAPTYYRAPRTAIARKHRKRVGTRRRSRRV